MKKGSEKVYFGLGLKNCRAQVTIFIIIAILIVVGIFAYLILRNNYTQQMPKNMEPVYSYYLSCLERNTQQGISLLEEQGGYINPPKFVPGSSYMPFSSQLDFFGQPVPYWMYVSGNNIVKEQVPTKSSMEKELSTYVKDRLNYCDFSTFEEQGFDVFVDSGNVDVTINDLSVDVNTDNSLSIYFENQSVVINKHKISVGSKLGKFYNMALDVYNYEKKNMFLEDYALDVLRLYAPVTGVELSCSPKIFDENSIRNNLTEGLVANIGAIKLNGNYYSLRNKDNRYFVVDTGKSVSENVNFIYSKDFPSRIEIYGNKVAMPVGLQEGLGMLGFCYIPYNLVYDIDFPVLIQFYDSNEVFQFPISVIIDKNQARNALPSTLNESSESEICQFKNKLVKVKTYDSSLNPISSDVKYKCLNTECYIGKTEINGNEAVLEDYFPTCVNGFVIAQAPGYLSSKYELSTNEETSASIVLNKLYSIPIEINTEDQAIISFQSDSYSTSVLYPSLKSVQLAEGPYNISVYVFKNNSLKIPASMTQKCVEVPKSGFMGVIGLTEEKCIDVNISEQNVQFAVVGGGKTSDYFAESQLQDAGKLSIVVPLLKMPSTLEDVQNNYDEIDASKIEVSLI